MVYRVAFGALALLVLYLLFWLDVAIAQSCVDLQGPLGNLLRRGSILPVLFVVILLCSAVELDRMLRTKGAIPHTRFAFLMITLLILTPWFCAAGWLGSGPNQDEEFYWMAIWLVMTVMGAALLTVIRQQPGGTIRDVGATLSMIFYIGFMGSFITLLRCGQDLPAEKGAWLLLMVVMVTKASDISAYFVGSTLGRHKLVPRISPGKTVEGTLGGMAGSALLATFFASTSDLFHPTAFSGNTSLLVEQPLAVPLQRLYEFGWRHKEMLSRIQAAILVGER